MARSSKITGSFRLIKTVDHPETVNRKQSLEYQQTKTRLEAEIKALESELDDMHKQKSRITSQLYAQKHLEANHGAQTGLSSVMEVSKGYQVIEAGLLRELQTAQEQAEALDGELALADQALNLVRNEELYFAGQQEYLTETLALERAEHEARSAELLGLQRQVARQQHRRQQLQLQERKIEHLRRELNTDVTNPPQKALQDAPAHVQSVRPLHSALPAAVVDQMLSTHPVVPTFASMFQKIAAKGPSTIQVVTHSIRDGKLDAS